MGCGNLGAKIEIHGILVSSFSFFPFILLFLPNDQIDRVGRGEGIGYKIL